jgi:hypothetical protein
MDWVIGAGIEEVDGSGMKARRGGSLQSLCEMSQIIEKVKEV